MTKQRELQQLFERNSNGDRVGQYGFVWDAQKLTPVEPRIAEELFRDKKVANERN